jgi:hypothetical protein
VIVPHEGLQTGFKVGACARSPAAAGSVNTSAANKTVKLVLIWTS